MKHLVEGIQQGTGPATDNLKTLSYTVTKPPTIGRSNIGLLAVSDRVIRHGHTDTRTYVLTERSLRVSMKKSLKN